MRKLAIVVLTLVTVIAACGKKPQPTRPEPMERGPSAPFNSQPTPNEDAEGRAREMDEALRMEEVRRTRATLEQMVFFDYDLANLREDAKATLDAKLPILRAQPETRIRIEAHADERGSDEYNLALSLRRAHSVRTYLADFGISGSRVEVVGFGEERPLDAGTSDAAHARNRRAEFRIIAGLANDGR